MHVEKNVCDNIVGTLLDIPGKNKDSLNARLDLGILKIHEKLQAKKVGEKYQVPKAPYNLTLAERRQIAKLLSKLTLPDGYSSNIAKCVTLEDGRVSKMKSHDCHVFMQDLLVPAFCGVVDDAVLEPLAEISTYFKQLCSRTLSVDLLEQMEKNISITLSKLQRIFIPAFFDVMVHLVVHLATEAKLAGPVHYRWMYRFEREMHTFKSYVRNKARPEGSIAEAYIADECLTFCSRYLTKTETQFNRVQRNDYPIESCSFGLSIFSKLGKPLGKASYNHLSFDEWRQAQSYVLKNCPEVDPFLRAMNSLQSHSQSVQQDKGSTGSVYSEGSCSSYRENRRLQQSQATNGKNTRGRTRGIKWQIERKRKLGVKPSCHITKDMKRIIGDNADQFITEVGHWVRNTLSLRCSRWKAMDNMYKERLLKKIQAEWNLPDEESVNRVVENQCKALYRQWRYRLKEQYFDGFSIAEALKNCPKDVNPADWKWIVENYWGSEKQKHISQINRDNRAKQKVKAVQGSKSTARILDLLRKTRRLAVSSEASEEAPQSTEDGSEACGASEPPPPPEYISLWELTKRHKDKSMDKFVEDKLEEFKQLHEEQLKENGVDNLTVEEAYMRVLGTSSGYINGLGYGPKPPKAKSGRVTYEESMQLKEQIQVLQQDKISMLEEIKKMKQDAMEREEKMKQDAMEREEKMKQDSKEREERMRKEFRLMMQEQLRAFTSGQMNLHK